MSSWIIDRRALLGAVGQLGGVALAGQATPGWAKTLSQGGAALPSSEVLSGEAITLRIGKGHVTIGGKPAKAITINGTVPGPMLRLKEGQMLRLTVINELDEPSSLHWHGLVLPFQMDGVPGVSFPGIPPRSSFTYEFPIVQHGTYWYHSHSGLQEMMGCYAPIVIEPAEALPAPLPSMREHVVLLSDHSFVNPARIARNLKVEADYYNRQPQTLSGLMAGHELSMDQRLMWAKMRMSPTDIADVTASVMHYLANGHGPDENWTGLFTPGETVRLRFINAASMTFFNVRIPGLAMQVVAADGQDVQPVTVEEFQFGAGETYDVIVTPQNRAYTIAAETMDRSGMARATLAPAAGMAAPVPPRRARPLLTMKDMGMDMSGGAMKGMSMKMRDGSLAPQVKMGPGVDMISAMPEDRMGDPGIGMGDVGHKVLTYRDLVALHPNPDLRAPEREIEVHLTGAMERYMWSMDGKTMSQAHEPIPMRKGERVRFTLVNDTMMAHPIHLHGHIFELVTGHGDHSPRKHTVTVQPGGKASFDVTAEPGDWAFHCHLFLHMAMGMMRVVQVRPA
ncbi:copper resistance system multicopper oxidase [Novosphingobium sp.]|uniref:copper resistance system multicopper oxidase n=1 Tax=Novosphingobium sp. TaxID=1874826 RepID=UPI0031DF0DC8